MALGSHSSAYLRKREAQERALAARSTDAQVQQIYLELAEWYRTLAENAEASQIPARSETEVAHDPCPGK